MGAPWLLIVIVAVVCAAVGVAVGVSWAQGALTGREPRAGAAPLAGDAVVPFLAALRSTVVVLDEDDEVLRASASAYTFNIVRDDSVCEPRVAEMVAAVRADGLVRDAQIAVARGRVVGAGQFFLDIRVAAIGDGRILILVDDRTAEKRVEDMRRDFVANVSHELKTPVGAISLLAETVEENVDDPELVRNFVGRMRKESVRLGVLVQEIIELSRLQDGDALVEPEDVDVDAVVSEALDRVRVEAEAKSITLAAGGTHGLRVRGDAALITTAVRNLLDNAIRYSPERTRVSIALSVDPEDADLVRIAVVDQGIGIPRDKQERVFERFYRVDKARSRATGGTGLGLSIVKHVAADHGGTVELWSTPGRGSTFTLILPRLVPEPEHQEGTDQVQAAVAAGAAGAAFAAIAAISSPDEAPRRDGRRAVTVPAPPRDPEGKKHT